MICLNYKHAIEQARANARTFGVPYVVFGYVGSWHCDPLASFSKLPDGAEVIHPES